MNADEEIAEALMVSGWNFAGERDFAGAIEPELCFGNVRVGKEFVEVFF